MLSSASHRASLVIRTACNAGARMALGVGLLAACIVPSLAQTIENTRVASVQTEVAEAQTDAVTSDKQRTDAPPASPMVPVATSRAANPRALYRSLIEQEVRLTSLPADVAEAVMGVESGYEPSRIGADGEIGLMQVMPATARMLGYSGDMAGFAAPEINIKYGVRYLAQAWSKAGGDLCTALMKYRAGHGETRFSQLSVDYCTKARARLAAKGYPLTGTVPVATFGFRPGLGGGTSMASCRKRCLTLGGVGRVDFAALNNRLAQVAIQINVPKTAGK